MKETAKGPDGRPIQIFTPTIAAPPPHLAGRDGELGSLGLAVRDMLGTGVGGCPVLLFGPRGMGKTALLRKFEIDPPHGADVRRTTPSTGLADINNIPRIFLTARRDWRDYIPNRAGAGIPGVAGLEFGWDMKEADSAERIKNAIIGKCAKRPKVLIVDEAHMLKREEGEFFLNYMQDIVRSARLLVVLAGTPNLRSVINRLGASFISRRTEMPLGRLSAEAARDSIKVPLDKHRVSIDDAALERVTDSSHSYPYFLQLWGESLWRARPMPGGDLIGMNELKKVQGAVDERKQRHYGGYYSEIASLEHLAAAAAIAKAFAEGGDAMDSEDAFEHVFSAVGPSLGETEREREAERVFEHLKAKDVLWEPKDGVVEAALPSFHAYILARSRKKEAARRRRGGSPGRGDGR